MTPSTIPAVLSAPELTALLAERPEVRLLDVRTPGEFERVHIAGAYNVPLDTLAEHAGEIQVHVSEPLVLICQSGQRARQAEVALQRAGMPNLHVLDGGMHAWLRDGRPAVHGSQRLSLERQVRIAAGALAASGGLLALLAHPAFAVVPLLIGSGLVFAGITNTCGLALLLSRLPYNRPARCDIAAMVAALNTGQPPAGLSRTPGRLVMTCEADQS